MSLYLDDKRIVIFGGTGFIGKNLINLLSKSSCSIKIITRRHVRQNELRFLGGLGQIEVVKISDFSESGIEQILKDSDVVINLIGILYEKKFQKFEFVHYEIPKLISKLCRKYKVEKFIHMSSLGVEDSKESNYALSKLKGENVIKENFPEAIILKPSVVFGEDDNFINFFNQLSIFFPILPIMGTPKIYLKRKYLPVFDFQSGVRFQPIYVGDLCEYIIQTAFEKNKIIKLAGPNIVYFKEIIQIILNINKRKRLLIPIPLIFANLLATFTEKLPKPPLTRDQVKLLKNDNISNEGLKNLKKYIEFPKSLETVLPTYIF